MEKDKSKQNLDEYVKLSAFADVEIGITAAKTINEAMEQVMTKIGDIFSPVTHIFLLIDKDTDQLYVKLAQGESTDKLRGYKMPKGEGLANWIRQHGKGNFIEDIKKDSRFSINFDKLTDYDVKSTMGAPLEVSDKIIGVFQLINKTNEETYSNADLSIMKTIAEYAAMAIEKVYYLSAMRDMDMIDSLTGVYKRRNFDNLFSKEAERAKRYNNPVSLLIVNIDGFKTINNLHGYKAGDQILKALAIIIKKAVRRVDIVARFSGDEFAVLMPQTYKKNAYLVQDRIAKDIENAGRGGVIPYTVSIGLSSAGEKDAENLVAKTEKDLLKQKKIKADKVKKPIRKKGKIIK